MSAGKHRKNREPSPEWPMVFLRGIWFRSGYPSTYDAWPVMAEHQPQWQQKLSGVSL